jgi:hypothetical protein
MEMFSWPLLPRPLPRKISKWNTACRSRVRGAATAIVHILRDLADGRGSLAWHQSRKTTFSGIAVFGEFPQRINGLRRWKIGENAPEWRPGR